jgi:hypothetical protein
MAMNAGGVSAGVTMRPSDETPRGITDHGFTRKEGVVVVVKSRHASGVPGATDDWEGSIAEKRTVYTAAY